LKNAFFEPVQVGECARRGACPVQNLKKKIRPGGKKLENRAIKIFMKAVSALALVRIYVRISNPPVWTDNSSTFNAL
jgi:hypothetical protein